MSHKIKMHIDGQVLSEVEKTGIGWCVYNITKKIAARDDAEIQINYFSRGHSDVQKKQVYAFESANVRIKEITGIKSWVYKMISLVCPIPYRALFGADASVSCFMNYYVPPFAAGKRLSIVYDMVAKAYPETMDFKTRLILGTTLRSSIKRADKILTISKAAKDEIIKYFKVAPSKIAVMPMGVSDAFYPVTDGIEQIKEKYGVNGDYFMYLGTLEPRKNIETLIKAYSILKREITAPKLVIAGRKGWGYDGIFALVNELELEKDVIFTGYLDKAEIPALLSSARAFIFPSVYEGFGMPPLEAMACGCPVITSNVSAMPEVAGDAAIMCDPEKPEEFALAMKRVATDGKLANDMREKGLVRAKEYTWDNAAEIFMGAARELSNEQEGKSNVYA